MRNESIENFQIWMNRFSFWFLEFGAQPTGDKKSASAHLIIHMAKCSCKAYSHALLLRIGHFDLMARTLTCLCTTNDVSFPFSVSRSRTRVTLAFTLSVSQLWIWLDVKVNETAMDSLRIWTTPMLCGIVDHIQQKSSKYSHLRSRSFGPSVSLKYIHLDFSWNVCCFFSSENRAHSHTKFIVDFDFWLSVNGIIMRFILSFIQYQLDCYAAHKSWWFFCFSLFVLLNNFINWQLIENDLEWMIG